MSNVKSELDYISKNINRTGKVLPVSEQIELIRVWQENGDRRAKQRVMLSYQRFVMKQASRVKDPGVIASRFQQGMIGLSQGIDRFDISKGFAPSTYLAWYIQKEIQEFHKKQERIIREPELVCRIERHIKTSNGRINIAELAEKFNTSEKTILRSLPGQRKVFSLDQPVAGTEDATLSEVIPKEYKSCPTSDEISIWDKLGIEGQDKDILVDKYVFDHTVKEIAAKYERTDLDVRKTLSRVKAQIKASMINPFKDESKLFEVMHIVEKPTSLNIPVIKEAMQLCLF